MGDNIWYVDIEHIERGRRSNSSLFSRPRHHFVDWSLHLGENRHPVDPVHFVLLLVQRVSWWLNIFSRLTVGPLTTYDRDCLGQNFPSKDELTLPPSGAVAASQQLQKFQFLLQWWEYIFAPFIYKKIWFNLQLKIELSHLLILKIVFVSVLPILMVPYCFFSDIHHLNGDRDPAQRRHAAAAQPGDLPGH